jgi:hypothetical protein
MSLPLPDQTYYRMADQVPAASTIAGLLNAIYAALTSTTDYRGTALPSTHLWTWARFQNAGTTECVYNSACPSGTSMGLTPAILLAGSSGAPTPTMLTPDTFTASNLLAGIVKSPGAFNAWDNANPMTSGTFSGYWRGFGTTWNSTGATVRVYIGEESILVTAFTTATGQTHGWIYIGAVGEPLSTGVGAGESDNRLYGMFVSGASAAVSTTWLNTSNTMWNHGTTAGAYHGGVFQPGAATWYAGGRRRAFSSAAVAGECSDTPGAYCGDLERFHRSTVNNQNDGARLGLIRSILWHGGAQGGRTLRNGATDLYHVIAPDNTAASAAFLLKAAA